jgi:hypothetical protein
MLSSIALSPLCQGRLYYTILKVTFKLLLWVIAMEMSLRAQQFRTFAFFTLARLRRIDF